MLFCRVPLQGVVQNFKQYLYVSHFFFWHFVKFQMVQLYNNTDSGYSLEEFSLNTFINTDDNIYISSEKNRETSTTIWSRFQLHQIKLYTWNVSQKIKGDYHKCKMQHLVIYWSMSYHKSHSLIFFLRLPTLLKLIKFCWTAPRQ